VTEHEQNVTKCAYAVAAALNKSFMDGGTTDAHDGAGGGVFDDSQEVVEGVQGEEVHAKAVNTENGVGVKRTAHFLRPHRD
jgi:hypothetical protein